jgi:hypothetical protein
LASDKRIIDKPMGVFLRFQLIAATPIAKIELKKKGIDRMFRIMGFVHFSDFLPINLSIDGGGQNQILTKESTFFKKISNA